MKTSELNFVFRNCKHYSLWRIAALTLFFIGNVTLAVRSQSQLTISLVRGDEIDYATIHFFEEGLPTFGDKIDTEETFSEGFDLYTVSADGQCLTSNGLPHFDCDETVKLVLFNASEGHYNLEFLKRNTFPEEINIELLDNFTKTTTCVVSQPVYEFDVTSNPESYNTDRFEIRFHTIPAPQDFNVRGSVRCHGVDGEIEISNTQPGIVYSISRNNSIVASMIGTGDTIRHLLAAATIQNGINSFQVQGGFSYCQTPYSKKVNVVVNPMFTTPVESGYRCDEGTVELKARMISEGGVFKWYKTQDSEIPIITQRESTFTTPVLDRTTTYYVSSTTVFGCEGPRQAVAAEITMPEPVAITVSGDTLRSNYKYGNKWYLNGVMIPGATSQNYIATGSGLYSVAVNVRTCSSEADIAYSGNTKPFILTAHPNPVATMVTVQIPGNVPNLSYLQVLNTVGLQVATVQLYAEGDKLVGQMDMSNFPVGIYVVRAGGDEATELKLIKL